MSSPITLFWRTIILYAFFGEFLFIYPLYAVMFQDFGLDSGDIATLFIIWSLSRLVLEVPSGALADVFSRKRLLIISQILRIGGLFLWMLVPTFYGFMLGFICWGIAEALSSGTLEAFVYDELAATGQKSLYSKLRGQMRTASEVAIALAGIGASLSIVLGYDFILWVSIASVTLCLLCILRIPPAKKRESTGEIAYWMTLKQGIAATYRSPFLRKTIFLLGAAIAIFGSLEEFFPLFDIEVGLPIWAIGYYVALLSVSAAIGSLYSHKFEQLSTKTLTTFLILSSLMLIATAQIATVPILLLIIPFYLLFVPTTTALEAKMQHRISTSVRATISSVYGFLIEVGAIATSLLVGWLAQWSYAFAFFIAGMLLLTCSILYRLQASRQNKY